MSLFTPTEDGLLGTHVTWQDVEDALKSVLNTEACFGAQKTVRNIAEMKGFLSRIAMIEPDWVRPNMEENNKLPEKLVVKIASQLALMEIAQLTGNSSLEKEKIPQMAQVTKSMHNREVEMCKLLEKSGSSRIPHAKMYYSKAFQKDDDLKAFMIFEYIPNRHVHMHQSIPTEQLLSVLRATASLSALGETLPKADLSFVGGTDFWEMMLKDMTDEEGTKRTCDVIRRAFLEEHLEKCEKMLEIYRNFYTNPRILRNFTTIEKFLNHKPVLGHGDLWNSNLLFDDEMVLKAIIDFQTVAWCSPALDLARLLACVLTTAERREKKDFLLQEFYKAFTEELHGQEVPYTLQQLRDSYSLIFPIMGMIIIPGIAGLAAHESSSDQKRIDATMDKLVGLMEDVIATHESNQLFFPTFFE